MLSSIFEGFRAQKWVKNLILIVDWIIDSVDGINSATPAISLLSIQNLLGPPLGGIEESRLLNNPSGATPTFRASLGHNFYYIEVILKHA